MMPIESPFAGRRLRRVAAILSAVTLLALGATGCGGGGGESASAEPPPPANGGGGGGSSSSSGGGGGGTGTGSASLSWVAPTQRTDGSPFSDLAGYRIYYGTTPNSYQNTVNVQGAGMTRYVVENLSQGTWYFRIAAVDSAGTESAPSNSASKTVS